MHLFQILGQSNFQTLVRSGVISVHVTKFSFFINHPSGCYFTANFSQVTGIHCNGVTLTIKCGTVWCSVWLNSGFFSVNL